MAEYITIAEASRRTGKHRDTIRNWTKTHSQSLKIVDGKKLIKADVLALDYPMEQAKKIDISQPSADYEAIRKELDELKAENRRLQERNDKLTDKISELADALVKLTDQQQQLTAQYTQKMLMAEAESQPTEKPAKRFNLFRRKDR